MYDCQTVIVKIFIETDSTNSFHDKCLINSDLVDYSKIKNALNKWSGNAVKLLNVEEMVINFPYIFKYDITISGDIEFKDKFKFIATVRNDKITHLSVYNDDSSYTIL